MYVVAVVIFHLYSSKSLNTLLFCYSRWSEVGLVQCVFLCLSIEV